MQFKQNPLVLEHEEANAALYKAMVNWRAARAAFVKAEMNGGWMEARKHYRATIKAAKDELARAREKHEGTVLPFRERLEAARQAKAKAKERMERASAAAKAQRAKWDSEII